MSRTLSFNQGMAEDQSNTHFFYPFQPSTFQFRVWNGKFGKLKNLDALDGENGAFYRQIDGLGFGRTFGQLVNQTSCPSISLKWKLSDLRFLSKRCVCHKLGVYASYTPRTHIYMPQPNQVRNGLLGLVLESQLELDLNCIGPLLGIFFIELHTRY